MEKQDHSTIYVIENISDARIFFLSAAENQKFIITNAKGSGRYYGMLVLHYIFCTLKEEFPSNISDIIVDATNDYVSYKTATDLGYKKILYTCYEKKYSL